MLRLSGTISLQLFFVSPGTALPLGGERGPGVRGRAFLGRRLKTFAGVRIKNALSGHDRCGRVLTARRICLVDTPFAVGNPAASDLFARKPIDRYYVDFVCRERLLDHRTRWAANIRNAR